ncbi:hypothetical protein RRF57_011944 [Xylaria bambusicola]|uniref:Uncharacterized protein n=1 Tax=Xylaria bambusicola TaxID=326684 RepID=A0AAN7ZAC1_9PEZI
MPRIIDVRNVSIHQITRGRLWPLSLVVSRLVAATNLTTADIGANEPPPPLLDGCLSNSLPAPVWFVDAFEYKDNYNGASTVNFILSSKIIANKLKCFSEAEGRRQSVQGECANEDEKHQSSSITRTDDWAWNFMLFTVSLVRFMKRTCNSPDYARTERRTAYSACARVILSQFFFEPSSRNFSIECEWSRNGNGVRESANFVGNGTTKLEINSVNSTRILVKLHKPLEVPPYIPPSPPGHSTPGCSSRSKLPVWLKWNISEFTWYIVKVKNQAIQQTFVCGWQTYAEGSLTQPRENWWCNGYSEEEVKPPKHTYEAEILFRHISKEEKLIVNQTWYCDDEDREAPEKFHATGSVTVESVTFPGNSLTPRNYVIEGKLELHYEMEPYALELPNAQAARCTVTSFDAQCFFLIGRKSETPTYWTYENSSTSVRGDFSLIMRFPFEGDDNIVCGVNGPELYPTKFEPERWWNCQMVTWGGDPMNIKALDFNYNRDTTILSINATVATVRFSGPEYNITSIQFAIHKLYVRYISLSVTRVFDEREVLIESF